MSVKIKNVNYKLIEKALNDGIKTRDIGGKATSKQMTKAIEHRLIK